MHKMCLKHLMNSKKYLIFSGHNDRAVITLCRFMSRQNIDFQIVARDASDPIFNSPWGKNVSLIRSDRSVDLNLFKKIKNSSQDTLIYCPTTEFINDFSMKNRNELNRMGFDIPLPEYGIYSKLSNKKSSSEYIQQLCDLIPPQDIPWGSRELPCVFKPKSNISSGAVAYPKICFTDQDLEDSYLDLDPQQWFIQKYITGQSYYLCSYLSQCGEYASFWQENLVQQANGKSIVLARSSNNPGVNENKLFEKLHKSGYHGPLMMEIIIDANGSIYFIEINPRFWGPLQLALDACPHLLELFISDTSRHHVQPLPRLTEPTWYSWAEGAQTAGCKIYPAAAVLSPVELAELIQKSDVYQKAKNHV